MPDPAATILRQLQKDYGPDRWKVNIAPHITLVPPGSALVPLDEAIRSFERMALEIDVFPLTLKGFRHFDEKVVFVRVLPSPELLELWDTVNEALVGKIISDNGRIIPGYTPHATVANRLKSEEFKKVWGAVSKQEFEFSFSVSEVGLFKKDPMDKIWQEVSAADLQA